MRAAILLGIAAFLVVLVMRLPASWVTPLLPPSAQCTSASGTLWRGVCEGLVLSDGKTTPMVLQQLSWSVRPAAMLRGRLASEVEVLSDWGQVRADVTLRSGPRLSIESLSASGTLDRRLLPVLPAGWTGSFEAHDVAVQMQERRLLSAQGIATVRGLQDANGQGYGDYQLQLAPQGDAAAAGELRDTGGPIDLLAKVSVAQDLNWIVDGSVGTRGGQLPQLEQQLQMLGAPDASGRRPLSVSGNF